jgi:anti-sigma factor ChrR (cupin superfamily)
VSEPGGRALHSEGHHLTLEQITGGGIAWQPFRPGIEILRLHGDTAHGPSSALLRYAPGAQLACHVHTSHEHIVVLSGSQRDERGVYTAGSVIVNVPGSQHSVTSDEGCVVLAVWEAPVRFVGTDSPPADTTRMRVD